MPPIIQVKNLTKRFGPPVGGVLAVDRVSFSVQEGEIVGFLGPNGAGKTTTIQMLLGLLEPTSGIIKVFGKPLKDHREEILAQVGFSSAYISLPYNLTVREALKIFGLLFGVPNVKQAVNRLIEQFHIERLKNRLVGRLSSGQVSRLNLAKAFINQPKILFLDEPTASLDPVVSSRTRKLLLDLQKQYNLTMFYTSHNMTEVEKLCDRIIFINHGQIIAEGTPTQLKSWYRKRNLEQAFIKLADREAE